MEKSFADYEVLLEGLSGYSVMEFEIKKFLRNKFEAYVKKDVVFDLHAFEGNGYGDGWQAAFRLIRGVNPDKYNKLSDWLSEYTGEIVGGEYRTFEDDYLKFVITYVDAQLRESVANGSISAEVFDEDASYQIALGIADCYIDLSFDEIYELNE